jgi:glycosyltransferase involved in cell wall biosynthesis
MHVYFIDNENPFRDSSGGTMSYIVNVSKFLEQRQIKTSLIGSGHEDEIKSANSDIAFSEYIPVTEKNNISNLRYILTLIFKIRFLGIEKSAIIHAQRPDISIPAVLLNKGNPIVCSLHGAHDKAVFDKKGVFHGYLYSFLQRLSFRKADVLVAVDDDTKKYFLGKYPWIEGKITVVPIAVDMDRFQPLDKMKIREKYNFGNDDKIIIFVGRLEKEKNLLMLINAFSKIKGKIANAKLVLVGRGREEHKLREKIRELKLECVIFMDEVENEKVPELLNCADVFAFCSFYEGSPTVIKEALACNVPVVSADVGDVGKVLENIDGCYIADNNVDDFTQKIMRVLEEGRKINSREKMLQFSCESIGEATLLIYESLSKEV